MDDLPKGAVVAGNKNVGLLLLGKIGYPILFLLVGILLFWGFLVGCLFLFKYGRLTDQGFYVVRSIVKNEKISSVYQPLVVNLFDKTQDKNEKILRDHFAPGNIYLIRDKNYEGNYIYGVIGIVEDVQNYTGGMKLMRVITRGGKQISLLFSDEKSLLIASSSLTVGKKYTAKSTLIEKDWLIEARFISNKGYKETMSLGGGEPMLIDVLFKLQ